MLQKESGGERISPDDAFFEAEIDGQELITIDDVSEEEEEVVGSDSDED